MSNNSATDKQISFYNALLNEIITYGKGEFTSEAIETAREAFPGRTVASASDAIERAKRTVARLKPVAAPVAKPEIPSGHYALTVDGVVKFYKVDVVTEGKWAGRTFVSAQASDEFFPIKNRESRDEILRAIAADVRGALTLYGHSLGVCGLCRRTLTDEASRAAGIGPICAGKL